MSGGSLGGIRETPALGPGSRAELVPDSALIAALREGRMNRLTPSGRVVLDQALTAGLMSLAADRLESLLSPAAGSVAKPVARVVIEELGPICKYFSEVDGRLAGLGLGEHDLYTAPISYGIIDPDYARVFTIARCIAWSEGYALAMHGSFTRDLDLIAIPWTEQATDAEHLVKRVALALDDLNLLVKDTSGKTASKKPHGRLAWTLTFKAFGDPRFVDLSVMPRKLADAPKKETP